MHLIRERERERDTQKGKKETVCSLLSFPPEEKTKRLQQKQIHYCSREESVTTYAAVEPKTRKTKKKKRKKKTKKQKTPPVYRAYRVSTCNVKPGYERRHTSDASPQMAVFQTTVQGCSLRLNMGKGK